MSKTSNDSFRYGLVKSTLPEAKGVLMGRFEHNGTVGEDEFVASMTENRPNIDAASARLMLDAMGATIIDRETRTPGRIDLGGLSVEPAIASSMPALDSPLGKENRIYLAASLGTDLRGCLDDIHPVRVSSDELDVRLENVVGTGRRTIKGTEPFELQAVGLSLSGEDEGVQVVSDSGEEAEAVCDGDDGTGQRFTMHLAAALPAGKARVVASTRGRGASADAPLFATNVLNITVLAGETPPEPSTPTVTAINGGGVFSAGDNTVHGTNMRFADAHPASHIVLKNGEGQVVTGVAFTDQGTASETEFHVIVADNEGTLADGADYTWEFAMVDSQGNPVTVTKTARWVSE